MFRPKPEPSKPSPGVQTTALPEGHSAGWLGSTSNTGLPEHESQAQHLKVFFQGETERDRERQRDTKYRLR
jgi:hypothetical protein